MNAPSFPTAPLRPPSKVMRLSQMGAFHPTRLSFTRTLIRDLAAERARPERTLWALDEEGYGRAVLTVRLGGRPYSLVAFSTPLEPEQRTDRVIAEAWDSTYALYDGVPNRAALDRLERNAPRQEAGRFTETELVLSRANKSQRLFAHVVDRLSAGEQPDAAMIDQVGYLMRTTAVYGNGKFGVADHDMISGRAHLGGPFRAEMLAVWLIREFTLLLAQHVAAARNPSAATLSPHLRRHLGVGNATGLGMAPFLVSHPLLLNNWMLARETALARVLALAAAEDGSLSRFGFLLDRARAHAASWSVEDQRQMKRIERLRRELAEISPPSGPSPWRRLFDQPRSAEGEEMLVSLLIETHPHLVDDLPGRMGAPMAMRLDPGEPVSALRDRLLRDYDWALAIDFDQQKETRRFWYVSADKLEPRLGDRYAEPGSDLERPLDIARRAQALAAALERASGTLTVAEFLGQHPDQRAMVRRVQSAERHPYMEIRDNLIGEECLPIDMLRSKLSLFGASKFDPKSDLWTRVTLFQGAPTGQEIAEPGADDWAFPVLSA